MKHSQNANTLCRPLPSTLPGGSTALSVVFLVITRLRVPRFRLFTSLFCPTVAPPDSLGTKKAKAVVRIWARVDFHHDQQLGENRRKSKACGMGVAQQYVKIPSADFTWSSVPTRTGQTACQGASVIPD